MNNINFTGLKNIGSCIFTTNHPTGLFGIKNDFLIANLTDDYNGKDLSEFYEVLKKCQNSSGISKNKDDPRFIQIITRTVVNAINPCENNIIQVLVNGKEIEVKDENLPLFTYLAKLTRKIGNMKNSEFIYDNDFKYGDAGKKYLIPNYDLDILSNSIGMKSRDLADKIYSSDISRKGAKTINKIIHKQMINYLG